MPVQERPTKPFECHPDHIAPALVPGMLVVSNDAILGIITVVPGSAISDEVKDQGGLHYHSGTRKTCQVSLLSCELEHRTGALPGRLEDLDV